MIFRTLVVLQAAYVALATETSGWSYLEWENHDGVQVSSDFDFEIQWDYEIIQQLRGWLCISFDAYANEWPFKMPQPKDIFPGQLFALTLQKISPNLTLFFFQVGSKYIFFPVPAGTTPEAKTFDEADADCTSKGATLAYPEDDVENAAIIYFLTEHFGGDPAAVANGLGAWLGIIKPDGVQNFTYHDTGEIASYTPFLARFSFISTLNHTLSLKPTLY